MDTIISNNETYINLILGAITLKQFIVYLFYSIFGLCLSLLLSVYKDWPNIQATGGFQLSYWAKMNLPKVILCIPFIIAGILFSNSILGMDVNNSVAFFAGFFIDKTIDSFIKNNKLK